jgi:hypothetical protein
MVINLKTKEEHSVEKISLVSSYNCVPFQSRSKIPHGLTTGPHPFRVPTHKKKASTLSLCNVWHISVWSRTSAMNAPRHSFTELRDRCVKHSFSVSKSVSSLVSNQTTATLTRISILLINSSSCDIYHSSISAKPDDLRRNYSSYLPRCP